MLVTILCKPSIRMISPRGFLAGPDTLVATMIVPPDCVRYASSPISVGRRELDRLAEEDGVGQTRDARKV